jgi:signal transduction histidine kinase
VRAQLLRDLEEAREPFRFLTVIFMACWLTLLIAFLVISRVFNRSLVRPVLHLADTAEFVSREKTLPPDFARDSSRHAGSEVAALHQAFFDMVTSLHQAMTRAEVADRTKSDFLSMVSHEIRTPLTSILGFTKIIDKEFKRRVLPVLDESGRDTGPARQRIRGNIDIILTEGGRLTELLNDVLDLAKLEAGRIDWRFEELSVADLADHTLRAMESLFQDKGLAWENRVQPDLPRVCGDRNRLTQVLVNLVSNAVKFTDSGLVAVEARLEAGMVLVSVSDTGPGIGADDVQAVFEKFRQGGDIDVNKPKGTGLGLPICKQIVEFHGGTIWVESEPGTGSTFCFTLPAHRVGDCLPPEEH